MIRNLVLFVLALLMLMVAGLYKINYLDYKSPMPYSQWNEITWADFKGFKRPSETLYGDDKFAFIVTNIEVNERSDGIIEVVSYFHPSRSYVFNKNTYDKGLLRHELYHFHITEYVARLIRKAFSANRSKDRSEIISKYQLKRDSLQNAYDEETYHGLVLSKQKEWEKAIDARLSETSNYANPVVQ